MEKINNDKNSHPKGVDHNQNIRSNGFYTETIINKKGFMSRFVVPFFVTLLCIVLSVCIIIITMILVKRYHNPDLKFPIIDLLEEPKISPSPSSPILNGNNKPPEEKDPDVKDPEDPESVITKYKDVVRIEVLPFEASPGIISAIENIMPSIAYIRCIYVEEQTTIIREASALIISEDGYMITSQSAIEGVCEENRTNFRENSQIEVYVNFDFNKKYYARLEGRDLVNGIALLKIDTKSVLNYAEYGDSDKLVIGESVLAVASGNSQSKGYVSAGIVSKLSHTFNDIILTSNETPEEILYNIGVTAHQNMQTDGGVITDLKGQVVGLSIYSCFGSDDPSFRILPINKVTEIIENFEIESLNNKFKANLSIGIDREIQELNIQAEEGEEQEVIKGVRVLHVGYAGPAFNKGLAKDDIIVSINDISFESPEGFMDLKNSYEPGDIVSLTVYRPEEDDDGIIESYTVQIIEIALDKEK